MPRRAKQKPNQLKRYSEAERLIAVSAVRELGGVVTQSVLRAVKAALKTDTLSFNTLVAWVNEREENAGITIIDDPDIPVAVDKKKRSVDSPNFAKAATIEIVDHTMRSYAERANDEYAIARTKGSEAARVMMEMIKLSQLLHGLPTEIVAIVPILQQIAAEFATDGVGLGDALEIWFNDYKAYKAETKVAQATESLGGDA